MNRPHTFSPASSLSYSNQVGSRQVTQPLRCVESPAGAGGAAIWWERVTEGRQWEQGARGQRSALSPVQIWQGLPRLPARGLAMAAPRPLPPASLCPGFSLPLNQPSFLVWKRSCSSPSWPFLPFREEKGKQHNKKFLCVSHRSQRRAPGKREGRSRRSLAEVPPGVLDRDPLPADPAHCAGHEPLLGRVSPRQHPRPRDCACLSTPSPTSP